MFEKLSKWFSKRSKKKSKKTIGFNIDESEDYKFSHVHETFCMWCESTSIGEECEGHEVKYDEGARNIQIFVKKAEKKKWRFIDGRWYCPACANIK